MERIVTILLIVIAAGFIYLGFADTPTVKGLCQIFALALIGAILGSLAANRWG